MAKALRVLREDVQSVGLRAALRSVIVDLVLGSSAVDKQACAGARTAARGVCVRQARGLGGPARALRARHDCWQAWGLGVRPPIRMAWPAAHDRFRRRASERPSAELRALCRAGTRGKVGGGGGDGDGDGGVAALEWRISVVPRELDGGV